MSDESLFGQGDVMFLKLWGMAQWDQEVKGSVLANGIEQLDGEVLDITNNQRFMTFRAGQDLLSQLKQLLTGRNEVPSATGMGQANGLAGLGIEKKKGLGVFAGWLIGVGASLNHVTFGVTKETVRIQGQDLAGKVAAGPAQLAQGHLELLGLLEGVGFQQVVDSAIGWKPGQAVDQFKSPMAQ
jgi:hypothetical protein